MNLRKFPVYSNSPKRLRRVAVSSGASCPVPATPFPVAFGQELAASREPQQNGGDDATGKPLAYLTPSDQEMLLRQQAMDKAQQGKLHEAVELFTLLIRYNQNSASNFNNRGLLHFQLGQFPEALSDYHQALRLNPHLGKVYNNRANCYAVLGDLDAAIADYETAIDLDPTDLRARLNQGITFRELELFELAIENFDLALQLGQFFRTTDMVGVPNVLEGHLYAERGHTYHLIGDWNYAIADYHRALEHLPLSGSSTSLSSRLRLQVREWMDDLLSPLQPE